MRLNHHSSQIYPFFNLGIERILLILEQKDAKFMPRPGFQDGENALGGNYDPKKNSSDNSPEDTLDRELKEEFWISAEPKETLSELLGADVEGISGTGEKSLPDKVLMHKTRAMGELLRSGPKYVGSIVEQFPEGFLKEGMPTLTVGTSLFTRELTEPEYLFMEELIDSHNGIITPDNYRWGSRVAIIDPRDIDGKNIRSAYGNHLVLNWLFDNGLLPGDGRPTQPNGPMIVDTLDYSLVTDLTPNGCPTYKGIKDVGIIIGKE